MPNLNIQNSSTQIELINRAKQFGPVKIDGICAGIAGMGMQAILARDLDTYDQRLNAINSIEIDQFKQTIDILNQNRIAVIKETKEKIHGLDKKIIVEEKNKLMNEVIIQEKLNQLKETIDQLITEGILKENEREQELARRKELMLFNALQQKAIEKAMVKLEPKEQYLLDAPIFFEGTKLYYHGYQYPQLFDKRSRPVAQNVKLSVPLLTPKILEATGGISFVDGFSGMYTLKLLTAYFSCFSALLKNNNIKSPIVFMLSNGNHQITIGYDPLQVQPWILIDANQLPTKNFSDTALLVNNILRAFGCVKETNFSTEIYVNKTDKNIINNLLTSFKTESCWIESQTVTDEKARWKDKDGYSWLYCVSKEGYLHYVKELLAHGSNVNEKNEYEEGATPLYIAAQNGHAAIVEELLAYGAKMDEKSKVGITPLYIAAQNGNVDVVKALL